VERNVNKLMTDKEIADQLDAEDRLINRGCKKKICDYCYGSGWRLRYECWKCHGKGYTWEWPLMR
jgi:hypothetical protein